MPANSEPAFLVKAYDDPVVIKINGRANYMNSAPLSDFFHRMIRKGKKNFVLDFQNCSGMDSTFLGIIVGAALAVRNNPPQGEIILCRLSSRNLELVRNLGLHRIVRVDAGDFPMHFDPPKEQLSNSPCQEVEKAKMILKAHENLAQIDEGNKTKFQDVISFLKNQIESD